MRITATTLPILAARVHTGRVVVFDTETTGGTACDEICQIAAAEYDGGALSRTLALSRRLRPDLPDHKLATLVDALAVDGVNSHDALDDTLACAGVLFKLLETQP